MQRSSLNWQKRAEQRLKLILKVLQTFPSLEKKTRVATQELKGEKASVQCTVQVKIVGRQWMMFLNTRYRGKAYPTDILSFQVPPAFVQLGLLGELVICLPILKAQAKAFRHTPEVELDVLLVHGILHLLGFDHELGKSQSITMAKWEWRILSRLLSERQLSTGLGLIDRVDSGRTKG